MKVDALTIAAVGGLAVLAYLVTSGRSASELATAGRDAFTSASSNTPPPTTIPEERELSDSERERIQRRERLVIGANIASGLATTIAGAFATSSSTER